MSLGAMEITIILLVVLLLFGGKKLPELAKGLGKGIKEFKKAKNDVSEEINKVTEDKD
jgi:sec-independent protein translocase protein TatA